MFIDSCLYISVFLVCLFTEPDVSLRTVAAVAAHFLTRFRAVMFSFSTSDIHNHFSFIFCQRFLRFFTLLYSILKRLDSEIARKEVK